MIELPLPVLPLLELWLALLAGIVVLLGWSVHRLRHGQPSSAGPFLVFPAVQRPSPAGAAIGPPAPAPSPGPVEARLEETVRFDPTLVGTVQILPGRLEIVGGTESGREFRFLRPSGQEIPEVTLGRAYGPEDRHIRLCENTVSRHHARMRYRDRRWRISNLSQTNPLCVNGRTVAAGEEVMLSDGDAIQLGGVELRYREGWP